MERLDQLAYTRPQAAKASGYSEDIIARAVRSGDLRESKPQLNGRRLGKGVILRSELERWLRAGDT